MRSRSAGLARERGRHVILGGEVPRTGEPGGERPEEGVGRRDGAVPGGERGAQLAEGLEAAPALRVAPARGVVPRHHEGKRVAGRVGRHAAADTLVEQLGIAGVVVGAAPVGGEHPAQAVHVGAAQPARGPGRVERGLRRAATPERKRHRMERGEVHLVALVDQPPVRERGHRPAGEDAAHREIGPEDDGALGGGVDVRPDEEAAGEPIEREAGPAPLRRERAGVGRSAPVHRRGRPPPGGALEARGPQTRRGGGPRDVDHQHVALVVEDLVRLERLVGGGRRRDRYAAGGQHLGEGLGAGGIGHERERGERPEHRPAARDPDPHGRLLYALLPPLTLPSALRHSPRTRSPV